MALTKSKKGWQTYVKLVCEADAQEKLKNIDVNVLSPIEAMNLLFELSNEANNL